jgi:sarcosine oxidase subunit gamma
MTAAVEILRRGPLYRWHQEAGAEWVCANGGMVPWRYAGSAADPSQLALADLCLVPRIGVKGWHIWDRLAKAGIAGPNRNNEACDLANGGACLRLGEREAMILDPIAGPSATVERIENAGSADGYYLVARRDTHAWFVLTGLHVPSLLSKMCSVDLRCDRFADRAIVQTSVAGVGTIILRRDFQTIPAFHLFLDNSSARYLWLSVMRGAGEFRGNAIGFERVKALAGGHQQ